MSAASHRFSSSLPRRLVTMNRGSCSRVEHAVVDPARPQKYFLRPPSTPSARHHTYFFAWASRANIVVVIGGT